MKMERILGTEKLEKLIVNSKWATNKGNINWLHMSQIALKKEIPYCNFIKTDFDSENICVEIEHWPFLGTTY